MFSVANLAPRSSCHYVSYVLMLERMPAIKTDSPGVIPLRVLILTLFNTFNAYPALVIRPCTQIFLLESLVLSFLVLGIVH